jgi:hypothetical protein
MKQWRHQLGVPCSPTRRAVSAGRLCVAINCCCSLTAPANPNACEPKPINPIAATTARLSAVAPTTRRRSREVGGASIKNGSASPAVTFTAIPATSAAAPARKRGLAPAVNSSAAASASSSSVSLWSPPTASSSRTGLRPTKAAVKRAERPSRNLRKTRLSPSGAAETPAEGSSDIASFPDARLNSAIATRLVATASAFNAHSPPASPSGAIA